MPLLSHSPYSLLRWVFGVYRFHLMLEASRSSPQEYDAVLSNLNANIGSLSNASCLSPANALASVASRSHFVAQLPLTMNSIQGWWLLGGFQVQSQHDQVPTSPSLVAPSSPPSLSPKRKRSLTSHSCERVMPGITTPTFSLPHLPQGGIPFSVSTQLACHGGG